MTSLCLISTCSLLLVLAPAHAAAQGHDAHPQAAQSRSKSDYAPFTARAVKALSEQQISDLAEGRGMGLALAAELNGYPGPTHVLELAEPLRLSVQQTAQTKALLEKMRAETIPLGQEIIEEEGKLDQLFAQKAVTSATLAASTARIAVSQGQLRAAHLRYHLTMMDVLTSPQIVRYNELRGYSAAKTAHEHPQGAAAHASLRDRRPLLHAPTVAGYPFWFVERQHNRQ